ncbi:MAG: hypothetical protein R3233_02460 [Xanthomonadales bacterium]|nr:hypothetical protein [Xanthomonadales bacterium]
MNRFTVALLLLPVVASAEIVTDQEQVGWSPDRPLIINGDSQQRLAQTVTAGISGRLDHVRLLLNCSDGTRGPVTVEIQALDAAGAPNGTVLGRSDLDSATLVTSPERPNEFRDFPFTGVELERGDRFAIVISGGPGVNCSTPTGPVPGNPFNYPRGQGWYAALPDDPATWSPIEPAGTDLVFYTRMEIPDPPRRRDRDCRFEDANGIPNDWLPSFVPVCGCLEDPGLRANRCWFMFPDLLLWRDIPWDIDRRGSTVLWNLLTMDPAFAGVRIQEASRDGRFDAKPVEFDKGLAPGQVHQLKSSAKGPAAPSSVRIVLPGPKGGDPIELEFKTGHPGPGHGDKALQKPEAAAPSGTD